MANSSKRLTAANVSLNEEVKNKEMYRKTTMKQRFLDEPKVPVTISPMYKPYFGEVMEIQINGIYVSVPCDGAPHQVPETFASEVNHRIMRVDDQQRRANRMADVTNNSESVQGEIQYFN